MSNEDDDLVIPRHAKAGVAFLGVEFNDALILIVSVFLGLAAGSAGKLDLIGYIGIPGAGYILNRSYLDWRSNSLPGQLQTWLYSKGIIGYSRAFSGQKDIFVGDAVAGNLGSIAMIDELIEECLGEARHGA